MKTKILFVSCVNPHIYIEKRYPPLGIGYLIAALKKSIGPENIEVAIAYDNIEKTVKTFAPDIVCISSTSPNYGLALKYARLIRAFHVPVIIGGVHVSVMPETLSLDMDVGVLGEGEAALTELVCLFREQGTFKKDELSKIDGIVYLDKGQRVLTQSRTPEPHLDSISRPDRSYFRRDAHSYMLTARGCPCHCTFCAAAGKETRFFSAEYMVEEIKELFYRYKARLITIGDDLFGINTARIEKIADLLEKEKLAGKVKLTCNCRANLVTKRLVALLQRLGIKSVGIGLESGSDRILNILKSGQVSVEKNRQAIEILREHKIHQVATFIIGSPGETREEILMTYRFIKETKLDYFDVFILTPFPGTQVWQEAQQRGLVSADMDWGKLNQTFSKPDEAIIVSDQVGRDELFDLYKKFMSLRRWTAFQHIWTHPYILDLPSYIWGMTSQKINEVFKS